MGFLQRSVDSILRHPPRPGRGRRWRDGFLVPFHLCLLPKRAVHPQCIESGRPHPSFLVSRASRPCDAFYGIVYVSGGGESHHRVHGTSRHPSPMFRPMQPSQVEKRGTCAGGNPGFFPSQKKSIVRGGRQAGTVHPALRETLPQLPTIGHLSRCCGQSRSPKPSVAVFSSHSRDGLSSPSLRTTSRRLLQPTPHNARRGEGRLRRK
jgi:hypothetical protein